MLDIIAIEMNVGGRGTILEQRGDDEQEEISKNIIFHRVPPVRKAAHD